MLQRLHVIYFLNRLQTLEKLRIETKLVLPFVFAAPVILNDEFINRPQNLLLSFVETWILNLQVSPMEHALYVKLVVLVVF